VSSEIEMMHLISMQKLQTLLKEEKWKEIPQNSKMNFNQPRILV